MITSILINFIMLIVGAIFSLFPTVTVASIPFVGQYINTALVFMVTTWNSFLDIFPYAQLPWHLVLTVIIPMEVSLLLLKFFLGHRLPTNSVR